MSGVVKQCNVFGADLARKARKRLGETPAICIEHEVGLKALVIEEGLERFGVARSIGQNTCNDVVAHADDQRQPFAVLLGEGVPDCKQDDQGREDPGREFCTPFHDLPSEPLSLNGLP
ncbi:hypothetical protein D9M72_492300 [compost metagenome]